MANKRYQETQDACESSRKLRANLREHPMLPQEAARVICDVQWEAWRVLRRFAQLDCESVGARRNAGRLIKNNLI
jgi:hypothetical protein